MRERNHSENLAVGGVIMLKLVLKKWGASVWTECIWLRTWTSDGLLRIQ
jgi:hypothetical protein